MFKVTQQAEKSVKMGQHIAHNTAVALILIVWLVSILTQEKRTILETLLTLQGKLDKTV